MSAEAAGVEWKLRAEPEAFTKTPVAEADISTTQV